MSSTYPPGMTRTRRIVRRGIAGAAVLLIVLAGALASARPAAADTSGELPGCWSTLWGVGPNFHWTTGSGGSNAAGQYSYSPLGQVPYGTACEDINVSHGPTWDVWQYRVRFYPSGGGNYANGWSSFCNACYGAIATNVQDGTWFRIEAQKNGWDGSVVWGDKRIDVWL
jgi:hypothetical protein